MLWGYSAIFLLLFGTSQALDLTGCAPQQPKVIDALLRLMGDIYSPGYKEGTNYPNEIFCQYTIKAPFGMRIRLEFVDMDVEAFDMCMGDAVEVFEGESRRNPVHGVFCGNQTYPDILSSKNALHIVFRTDFMASKRGFHLKYSITGFSNPCGLGQQRCRNRKCFYLNQACNGQDDCGDGTDEENCGLPIQPTTCGKRPQTDVASDWDRIVGGKEAVPGSWPWQADMQLSFYHPNGHACGGTLINAQWVVTAAHCFMNNKLPHEWRIHFGNHNKFRTDSSEQVRFVERIVVYPEITGDELLRWFLQDLTHDIALMKLNAPVTFTDQVTPACLPRSGYEIPTGTKCMATGWGMTRGSGSNSALKEVEMWIEKNEDCTGDQGPSNPQTHICVKNRNGNQDVCHGDSGGPLVCEVNGEWQVMGATSHGTRGNMIGGLCALDKSYTVYSKVSQKVPWILSVLNKYS